MPNVNSRTTALRRLYCLKRKLDLDPKFAEMYHREMKRLIENGFAKMASTNKTCSKLWYLPHFGVQNTKKPGKVRLVFDGAAKTVNTRFNSLF